MQITLPVCGTFFGTPVYLHRGDTIFQTSGPSYTSWVSEDHDAAWYIEKALADNQGNLVVIWDGGATKQSLLAMADYMALSDCDLEIPQPDWENRRFLTPQDWPEIAGHPERFGAGLIKMIDLARQYGLSAASIYTDAHPVQLKRLAEFENSFLGCNVGETFSFTLNSGSGSEKKGHRETTVANLKALAENFLQDVRNVVRNRKEKGWPRLMVTGGIAMLDYEIMGGIEIPAPEDFAAPHININSALARGLYRQFNLPLWGTDLAHEHYSFLPYSSRYKMPLLTASLYLKYMSGCKMIIVESGNWWQQSDHVEDTLMHRVPKLDFGSININDPHLSAPHVKEARKHYPNINYDSQVCRAYRRHISDFYDFLKANGTPAGQPAACIAAIKGNLDFVGPGNYNPNAVIAGQNQQAEKDLRWMHHYPERSWGIFENTFYPQPPVLGEHHNPFLSGTPYGITDIVSFASTPDADFLTKNYAALLFTGWNTCTAEQYKALVEYVRNGGTLFVSIPHLSTNSTRNFLNYGTEELINQGDFSELCGVRVLGRAARFYWIVTPNSNRPYGVSTTRKFGKCMIHRGEIELLPGTEVIAVEDEKFLPVLTRNRLGKGCVYFLNTWQHPGALDFDSGPGSKRDDIGLIGHIYRQIAIDTRGDVYISDDGHTPGLESGHIAFTWFPESDEVCLLNIDFDSPHTIFLHHKGSVQKITLEPAEFIRSTCG